MEKQKKILIIASIILVLLMGIFVLVKLLPEKDNNSNKSSNSQENNAVVEPLVGKSKEEISSVAIKNSLGEFTATRSGEGENVSYSISGLNDGENVEQLSIEELINNISNIKSLKIVADNLENAAIYGLENPTAQITVDCLDGSKIILKKGTNAPLSQGAYAMVDGKNKVYLISLSDLELFESSRAVYIQDKDTNSLEE